MRMLSTLLITTAALALGGSVSAQTRDGFFVGVGAGWGSAKATADEDVTDGGTSDSAREGSWTLNLRVGKALSDRLLAGVELNGWFDSEKGNDVSLFNTSVAAYYYPADRGLFVKGGLGLSRADFSIGGETVSGIGLGLMAGVGYDFEIGTSTAVTPAATFWYGRPGDLSLDNIVLLRGFHHNVFEVGVGITFY